MALTDAQKAKLVKLGQLETFKGQCDSKYRSESVMTSQQAGALFDSIFNPESDND